MPRALLIKTIPVLGSVVLFLCWVFQQTWLGTTNSTLQSIANAQGTFQTYQSNNALFNAVIEIIKSDTASVARVRRMQIYNYELGLRDLASLVGDDAKAAIPPAPNPFSGTPDVEEMMRLTQERLTTVQGALASRREAIVMRRATLNTVFFVLYGVGSLTVLFGAALSALAAASSPEARRS